MTPDHEAKPDSSGWAGIYKKEGYPHPENQSPWQQYFRETVGRFDEGMTFKGADQYRDIARKFTPRDNH